MSLAHLTPPQILLHCDSVPKAPEVVSFKGSSVVLRRSRNASSTFSLPRIYQQSFGYGRFAYDEYVSEEESDSEFQSSSKQLCASTLDNVEEWRWKLTMLMRRKDEQEVVSRGKGRRDFEQLSALATRMARHMRSSCVLVKPHCQIIDQIWIASVLEGGDDTNRVAEDGRFSSQGTLLQKGCE
ncbi:DExH-box ATP-dependent RNA helicase DExH3 [Sesamum alatum]|uniref:DExH-box ATP-dependent RNA helicase DExH3 n=1 Tax=Sesamum alatum TaxID=300844 RepID=A0AAE1XLI6_9LAMI|nr:DExH-box ATP-dependent RNA helicase DExH3 [Sesamum alatum]